MVPVSLSDWSLEIIQELCKAGRNESDRHDFKYTTRELNDPAKICCAFANSEGGFIVVGVKEVKGKFEAIGIPPDKELYGNFLKGVIVEPSLEISSPLILDIPASENKIYVIEIPKSIRRPHIPSRADKRYFYKRRGTNCEQMTLEEIRYQIHNFEEKKDKLTLLLIELNGIRDQILSEITNNEGRYSPSLYSVDFINIIVAETYSFLKADITTLQHLATIKHVVSGLNSEKNKLIMADAGPYTIEDKQVYVENYRKFVQTYSDIVLTRILAIEASFHRLFAISNPFPKNIDWGDK